ncbi:MAG: polysaccharide deacetylase family protein [Gammaproteobacteria bacterium]
MRRWLKTGLGRLVFAGGLHHLALRRAAVIVTFHRVDDALVGDPISCTRQTFRAFCEFFRTYFVVVSLDELCDKLARGADIGRHLVISFDDGYADNFEVAAAELRELGLPASFFVATGFVGTDRTPAWDAAKGIKSRWMTWDQVRSLHGQGFTLGAHTVNHVDLGAVSRAEAVGEIVGSKQRLEAEVGQAARHFAYPFGGPEHLTAANRREVVRAGFRTCLSAYGGVVRADTDPLAMRRVAITPWYRDPFQFGFELIRTAMDGAR